MEFERCARCGEPTVLIGQLVAGAEGYGRSFSPNHCRLHNRWAGVSIAGASRACVSCGHVWMSLDPARLREFVASHGEEIARQGLDEIDRGPYRDLPDTSLAR